MAILKADLLGLNSIEAEITLPGCEIVSGSRVVNGRQNSLEVGECLCEEVSAITALDAEHCTFEALYAEALNAPPELELPELPATFEAIYEDGLKDRGTTPRSPTGWLTGLKYLLHENLPERRSYLVCRAHVRSWIAGSAEVRVFRLPKIRLEIQGNLSVGSLTLDYFLDENLFLPVGKHPIVEDQFPLYSRIDEALGVFLKSQQQSSVAESIKALDEELRMTAGADSSPQVLTFIDDLTREVNSVDELNKRVALARTSLWDAPVLDEFGVHPLEYLLRQTDEFAARIKNVSPRIRTELYRALLPVERAEGLDRLFAMPSRLGQPLCPTM